jgi:hypothetical protein
LSVLNKDSTLILYIIFIFAPLCVWHVKHCPTGVP